MGRQVGLCLRLQVGFCCCREMMWLWRLECGQGCGNPVVMQKVRQGRNMRNWRRGKVVGRLVMRHLVVRRLMMRRLVVGWMNFGWMDR